MTALWREARDAVGRCTGVNVGPTGRDKVRDVSLDVAEGRRGPILGYCQNLIRALELPGLTGSVGKGYLAKVFPENLVKESLYNRVAMQQH